MDERNNEAAPHGEISPLEDLRRFPAAADLIEAAGEQQSNDLMTATNTNTAVTTVPAISPTTTEQARHQEADADEDVVQNDDDSEMVRKWKESPFAIGLTHATWADDDIGCVPTCLACCNGSTRAHIYCTACICRHFGCSRRVGRVGNMIVLRQTMEDVVNVNASDNAADNAAGNAETGTNAVVIQQRIRRPRLRCVVGPYWMITLFVVVPFFTVLSLWVARRLFTVDIDDQQQRLAVVLVWIFFTTGLFFSLFQVACSDPGIHYRHATRPGSNIAGDGDEWIWNDQALSYRPQHAKFDPDVQCIIKHFDHTCPWTSTAIGGGNILWFYLFLFFVFGTIFYDIILLTLLSALK
jgi:DHHC palmitoyltransferase